jgi:hypothetical protein
MKEIQQLKTDLNNLLNSTKSVLTAGCLSGVKALREVVNDIQKFVDQNIKK